MSSNNSIISEKISITREDGSPVTNINEEKLKEIILEMFQQKKKKKIVNYQSL